MGMEAFVRNFIRSSLVWLGVGVLLGVSMAWWPADHLIYRPAHAHANLLGFVSMMIFGVAYHVIPRFSGAALRSRAMARLHLWLANLGLAGMVGGWSLRPWMGDPGTTLIHAGAALSAVGTFLFIYNIWRTLGAAPSGPMAAQAAGRGGVTAHRGAPHPTQKSGTNGVRAGVR
jgi:heme/copper-type cytochrome/quinol oxidase subunit 1